MSCLPQPGDVVVCDELVHNSVRVSRNPFREGLGGGLGARLAVRSLDGGVLLLQTSFPNRSEGVGVGAYYYQLLGMFRPFGSLLYFSFRDLFRVSWGRTIHRWSCFFFIFMNFLFPNVLPRRWPQFLSRVKGYSMFLVKNSVASEIHVQRLRDHWYPYRWRGDHEHLERQRRCQSTTHHVLTRRSGAACA